MQNISRHIFIPPHAEHIRAYFHSPRIQNISGHILIPLPRIQNISGIFLSPSPHIQNISVAYFYSPPPHTKHIRAYSYSPPRMQTEPEHVFDCPHVCDGCTVRTDAIRHERTDVRKTRWTMKMYSGSVPLRESNYPIIRFPPGQHTLSYFPRAVLQIRSTHAIIPSEELSSTRSYPRLSSQRMHVFAL